MLRKYFVFHYDFCGGARFFYDFVALRLLLLQRGWTLAKMVQKYLQDNVSLENLALRSRLGLRFDGIPFTWHFASFMIHLMILDQECLELITCWMNVRRKMSHRKVQVITTQDFVPIFIECSELLVCLSLADLLIEIDEDETKAIKWTPKLVFDIKHT